ncbi:AraC family transcriptional regulator [Mesorhizobium sp. M1B.F.Ca.ET.045.04.1.1]|nr:AraC family transcriptional regulator [Mesorhizobium sp. M1B.F.Ca.ET.045.04.1.1]
MFRRPLVLHSPPAVGIVAIRRRWFRRGALPGRHDTSICRHAGQGHDGSCAFRGGPVGCGGPRVGLACSRRGGAVHPAPADPALPCRTPVPSGAGHRLRTRNGHAVWRSCQPCDRPIDGLHRTRAPSVGTPFASIAGQTPVEIRSLGRFQKTVRALMLNDSARTTDAALAYGYYDQAHFIRHFRELVAESPQRYLREARARTHFYNTSRWAGAMVMAPSHL